MPLLAGGLAFAGWVGGAAGVAESLAACLLLALPYVLLFLFAGGGAGDAKLMGAIGAWMGLYFGIVVLLAVAGAGIVFALAHAVAKRKVRIVIENVMVMFTACTAMLLARTPFSFAPTEASEEQHVDRIPYGLAIFAGVLVASGVLLLWPK